jgi:predicted phage terminase large subunit-like protein
LKPAKKTDRSAEAAAELRRREAVRELARRHLLDFTCYTKPDYEVSWHHRYLCEVLDKFARREIKRLIVCMPPRHGKSELVSRRLPAFLIGRDTGARIIATSYGADLARDMNRDVQSVMDCEEYLELFPGSALPGSNVRTVAYGTRLRNSDTFQLADPRTRGRYVCAGVGGPITGKGADYAIVDDPLKNDADACSQVIRDGQWKWFTTTLRTRLEKDACILITLTRWHEDDLVGRIDQLQRADPAADQYIKVVFPAIREDVSNPVDPRAMGEALWPGKYDLAALEATKASIGPRAWASLYQQRPAPDAGGMFPSSCWKIVDAAPKDTVKSVRYWDRAATSGSGDWTSGPLVLRDKQGAFCVADVVHLRGDPLAVERAIVNTAAQDGHGVTIGIEEDPGSAGKFETSYYSRRLAGYNVVIVPARESKETRARPYSAQVLAGNFSLVRAAWNGDWIGEHAAFPFGANDDQVDGGSGAFKLCTESDAIERLRKLTTGA